MEEKIITKGKFTKNNIVAITSFILSIISIIISLAIYDPFSPKNPWDDSWLNEAIFFDCPEGVGVFFYLSILFVIIGIFLLIMMNSCEITVTDKRVFGKAAFGKRVDLPIDKISSVAICAFKGVSVATSSGKISFLLCNNRDDVFDSISKLLVERQGKQSETIIKQEVHQSNADELKKYKDLLDSGVITQEEFDQKKKQLLGF